MTLLANLEEINANVTTDMNAVGLEDTPLHRLWFLQETLAAWVEDDHNKFDKSLYMVAAELAIFEMQMKLLNR